MALMRAETLPLLEAKGSIGPHEAVQDLHYFRLANSDGREDVIYSLMRYGITT